jgi:hypothetical protein
MKSPRWRRIVTGLAALLVGLLALEGLSSIALFVRDTPRRIREPLAERLHTEHDPELGWRHRASTAFSDLYGPGRSLSINAQGLRSTREYGPRGVGEPRRALCVGDSFTLGYGVDDEHTWPAHFERELEGWEALNMGQGGYGLDQAWLWYRRDGAALEHELVLFAFIADDFRRVRTPTFLGYAKPLVRWRDERLELTRVPVPSDDYERPFLTQNLPLLAELRCVALGLRLLGRDGTPARADKLVVDESEAERVAAGIFADLAARTRAAGRELALVALPSLDPRDWNRLAAWPEGLRRAWERAAADGTPLILLDDAFAALDPQARRELFLLDSELTAPGAKGHYSPRGNAFVAAAIAAACARLGLLDPRSPR